MNSITSATSSSAIALKMLQTGTAGKTKSAADSSDPVNQPMDPRSAYVLSPPVANALLTLADRTSSTDGAKARREDAIDGRPNITKPPVIIKDVRSGDVQKVSRLMFLSGNDPNGAEYNEILSELPTSLAANIKTLGAIDSAQIRLDDESLLNETKNMILGDFDTTGLTDKAKDWVRDHMAHSGPYDPDDARVQAVLNGTAKIIRGTDLPEVGYETRSNDIFRNNPVNGKRELVGKSTNISINPDFIRNFEEKNPGLKISPIYIMGDVALVIYPAAPNAPSAKQ